MASKNNNGYITGDVIIEILSRLSGKSLMRLKCVCKYWSTLIRNSSFISRHFHHHSNTGQLFVQHYDQSTEKYTFALFPNGTLANSRDDYYNLGDLQMPTDPGFLGILNGIIGLCVWNHIVLWNPAIREIRFVPIPEPDIPFFTDLQRSFSGFGLDPTTNNYKVVRVWAYGEHNDELDLNWLVAVYNLYADSWRTFEVDLPITSEERYGLSNTCMDGFYHWMTYFSDRITIFTFDMDKEVFGDIAGPPITIYYCGDIFLHNNSVSLIHLEHWDAGEKFFDIWVMKEKGFWSKELTIGPLLDVWDRPLGLWKNGEVIFLQNKTSDLVLYNYNTQEIKVFDQIRGYYGLKSAIYKENLVSIKRGNEHEEGNNAFDLTRIQDVPYCW
ncbi:F-box protein At5g62510-like [Cornus florida]|uniref:F-box protein At5g62510-like n=1 Tax=Cornus florida TaxID=4283 RepID=UPI002899095B|nr:F-box protein At5g62510-like [Cornus florida]